MAGHVLPHRVVGPPRRYQWVAGPLWLRDHDTDSSVSTAVTAGPAPAAVHPVTVQRSVPKVGRNDPCPCGSGKKYKYCHGA